MPNRFGGWALQQASQFDLGHVERIRCSEVEIRPSRQPANWNCDGELLDDPSLKVSLGRGSAQASR